MSALFAKIKQTTGTEVHLNLEEILPCDPLICTMYHLKIIVSNQARGYKTFFMLNSTEHENSIAHKNYNTDK